MALEIGEPICLLEPTKPILLNLNLNIDFDKFYQQIFGNNAHTSSNNHQENYDCGHRLADVFKSLTTSLIKDLDEFIQLRMNGYRQSIFNPKKRSPSTAIAISLAIVNLLTNVGSTVYLQMNYNELKSHLQAVIEQVKKDEILVDNIIDNVRILKDAENNIAIRANSLAEMLTQMHSTHACALLASLEKSDVSLLKLKFDLLKNDLIMSRLTPRVIPISLLNAMNENRIFKDTILEEDLSVFYHLSQLTLIKTDAAKPSITMAISVPKLMRSPSYVVLNVLNPPTTVKVNDVYYTFDTLVDVTQVAVPMEVIQRTNFSLAKLSPWDVNKLRLMSDCIVVNQRTFCKSLLPLPSPTKSCLSQILSHNITLSGGCRLNQRITTKTSLIGYEKGTTGTLITIPENFQVIGKTHKVTTILHHPRPAKLLICLMVPSRYTSIEISGSEEKLTIKQDINFDFHSPYGLDPLMALATKKLLNQTLGNILQFHSKLPALNETIDLKPMIRETVTMAPWSSLDTNNVLTYIVVGLIGFVVIVILGKYLMTKFVAPRAAWWPAKRPLKKNPAPENVSLERMIESTDETEGPEFPARESP